MVAKAVRGVSKKSAGIHKKKAEESGHDGIRVISDEYSGGPYNIDRAMELEDDNWIAFNSTQIKSAIGTSARSTPAIRTSLQSPATKATLILMTTLKPVPTPPPNSLTPEEQDLLLRKGVPSGPIILDCGKPPPYFVVLSRPTSAQTVEPASSGKPTVDPKT